MLITAANLQALRVGFDTSFRTGMGTVESLRERVSMTVPSTTGKNAYGWLQDMPKMREWMGERHVKSMSEASYEIVNDDFELTVGVDRNDILDDNLGQYSSMFEMMGESTAAQPEEMVWSTLANGFSNECFDGQNYFDDDHPIIGKDGKKTTYSNMIAGSASPWFLMSTKRVVKPIIFQDRQKPNFVNLDNLTDPNVFLNKQFIYGVDSRNAAGYGFPQLAVGAKAALDQSSYKEARQMIRSMTGDHGRPLGLKPDLLVVGPELEEVALELLNAENNAAGATNVWRGTAELLVVDWLAAV